jgi:hypothetical protein
LEHHVLGASPRLGDIAGPGRRYHCSITLLPPSAGVAADEGVKETRSLQNIICRKFWDAADCGSYLGVQLVLPKRGGGGVAWRSGEERVGYDGDDGGAVIKQRSGCCGAGVFPRESARIGKKRQFAAKRRFTVSLWK